jgi:hypothetical protein
MLLSRPLRFRLSRREEERSSASWSEPDASARFKGSGERRRLLRAGGEAERESLFMSSTSLLTSSSRPFLAAAAAALRDVGDGEREGLKDIDLSDIVASGGVR